MAAIKYADLINCVVSTEGSGGIMTNYFYYTVLVVYADGSRDFVTGQKDQIAFLIPYMRTPMDDIVDIKAAVKDIHQDINNIADQKIKYMIDTLYPIPDILNKNETEAIDAIKEAGLIPVLDISYPESTPKNGIVQAFSRNADNFKKVNIRIIHNLPEIKGLKIEEATEKLKEAGFTANITYKAVTDKDNGIVLNYNRANDTTLLVELEVSSTIPETKKMPAEEATKLLKEKGYDVIVTNQASNATPGTVYKWESIGQKKIRLYISIPDKYKSKIVQVKWTAMQDSTGDSYQATAEFDNSRQELFIKVYYKICTKSKHQITSITLANKLECAPPRINTGIMEPNTHGEMTISIPFYKPFEELPSDISIVLDTQYSLMKKKDPITLQFHFDW